MDKIKTCGEEMFRQNPETALMFLANEIYPHSPNTRVEDGQCIIHVVCEEVYSPTSNSKQWKELVIFYKKLLQDNFSKYSSGANMISGIGYELFKALESEKSLIIATIDLIQETKQ